jgi:phosphopantetheinyl transferase
MPLTTILTSSIDLPVIRPATSLGSLQGDRTSVFVIRTRNFSEDHVQNLLEYLDPAERTRAARFRFMRDHDSFVVVHGLLRLIVAHQFGLRPEKVELEYNLFGKPRLNARSGKMYFSLSHSREVSLLAFNFHHEIGADIEFMDTSFDFKSIAEACFTLSEQKYINHGTNGDATRFYRLWTRKEALLKAIGTGITEHLDVEVFREINLFHGKFTMHTEDQTSKFILTTTPFDGDYMITVATQEDAAGLHTAADPKTEPLFILN